ncbi:MAG: TIGR03118 family protein [Sinobacteraceae bacterium]|nr:TIGR03118 family protein [Nevskiaceae bacterium]
MTPATRTKLRARSGWFSMCVGAALLTACGGGGGGGMQQKTTPYSVTNLVSDGAAMAAHTDSHLVNPWGIAFGPGPAWVANNGTQTSTLYDGAGAPQSLVVQVPAGPNGDADPTGIVFNGSSDFAVSQGAASGPARFVFAGEGGMLYGWSPDVVADQAVVAYTASDGAVYKGLALASNGGANFLYATDFHNNKIDVFDKNFTRQPASAFPFTDPAPPLSGYAPFGIAAIGGKLYVSYGKQQAGSDDEQHGPGLGYVDVFNPDGSFVMHFASGGALNAPWGLVLAPADFGEFSNALLIGNFGDGAINAYDPASGRFLGSLKNAAGATIQIEGLWGIAFGNDADRQPHNTLFFAAGINDEANGLYGRIDVGATPPDLSDTTPPTVSLSAPSGDLSGTVMLTATASDDTGVTQVQFFVDGTSIGTATTAPYTLQWDTTQVADGQHTLIAKATDLAGNVGTSDPVQVTVANGSGMVTLTQIQSQVFTPICSSCHNGQGSTLPGSMDLRDGHSYSNIVNVASQEQPSLLRIKPGDPDNSYLIRKVQGEPNISGARMPFGCPNTQPCLSQQTIDMMRQWVAEGAQNN